MTANTDLLSYLQVFPGLLERVIGEFFIKKSLTGHYKISPNADPLLSLYWYIFEIFFWTISS